MGFNSGFKGLNTHENQSVVGSFHFTHNVKEKLLESYYSNTKIWSVNQMQNTMSIRRTKHNYEEGKKVRDINTDPTE